MGKKGLSGGVLMLWAAAACGPSAPPSAEAALDQALAKLGGATQDVAFRSLGVLNQAAELQGSRPGASDEAPFRETLALMSDGRLVHEMELHRIDGSREWVREVYEDGSKTIHLLADSVSVRLTDHPEAGGRTRLRRRFPGALLTEVASSDDVLEAARVGVSTTVLWRRQEGPDLSLLIGPDSLLHRVAYRATYPGLGETTVSWHLLDYQEGEAGLLPHAYRIEIGDRTFADMSVEWTTADAQRLEALAAPPEAFAGPHEVSGEGGPAGRAVVEELGPGFYRVQNLRTGFHPVFVEFDEFVAVVDAPTGYPLMLELPAGDVAPGPAPEWLSERFAELIRETVGEKPVQQVVLTHFHNDHGGGVGAFAGPGVTIYTSPGDSAAVADFLSGSPGQGATIVPVSAGARITDGTRTLDVIQIGGNPHTHEMLVAYLHDPETLFVSDLVPGATIETLQGADPTPTQAFFLAWLGRTTLGEARLLTMHGLETVDLGALSRP